MMDESYCLGTNGLEAVQDCPQFQKPQISHWFGPCDSLLFIHSDIILDWIRRLYWIALNYWLNIQSNIEFLVLNGIRARGISYLKKERIRKLHLPMHIWVQCEKICDPAPQGKGASISFDFTVFITPGTYSRPPLIFSHTEAWNHTTCSCWLPSHFSPLSDSAFSKKSF